MRSIPLDAKAALDAERACLGVLGGLAGRELVRKSEARRASPLSPELVLGDSRIKVKSEDGRSMNGCAIYASIWGRQSRTWPVQSQRRQVDERHTRAADGRSP